MSLNDIKVGKSSIVNEVLAKGKLKERLIALGLTKGLEVSVIRKGPKNHLTVFDIRGVMIALRKDESQLILVS